MGRLKVKILRIFFNLIYQLFYFLNKNLLLKFTAFIEKKSYSEIKINNKKIFFFSPNEILKWRIDTYFSKEPDTLKWIDKFSNKRNIIFWDIGSNIGLYSIYAALKKKNINITSFEPSTSNLRILSRNIFINKLIKRINICQIALSNKKNQFSFFNEHKFIEGYALHTLSRKINNNYENSYKIFSSDAYSLLQNSSLKCPHYIKIDVDGNELEILQGFRQQLKNPRIKEILIEIDVKSKNFKNILKIMKKNNFFSNKKFKTDKNSHDSSQFNFLFKKNYKRPSKKL